MWDCGWESAAQHHIVQSWGTEVGLHPQFICCIAKDIPTLLSLTHMLPPSQFAAVTSGEKPICASVQFSCSVVSDSLRPHEPQHTRPPCPSPAPGVHPNPCPLSRWCHPTISSYFPPLFSPSIFPSIRVFSNESAIRIRWPQYWSFSFNISPSNEHPICRTK